MSTLNPIIDCQEQYPCVGFFPIKMSFLPIEKFYKMIIIKLSYMSLSFNTINLNHVRIWSHEGYNIKRVAAVNI